MTLWAEIQTKCTPAEIAARDFHAIAAKVSVGRKAPSGLKIGKGTIVKAIGLTAANAFLDIVDTAPDFRHVKHLLVTGELDASDSLIADVINPMVPSVLTAAQAATLIALGERDDPVDWTAVQAAFDAQGA